MPLAQRTRASTPAPGHLIFIMRIVCQQRGGREEAASGSGSGGRGPFLMGKVLYCHLLLALMHCSHVCGTEEGSKRGGGTKKKKERNESSQSSYWEINSG